MAQQTDVAIVGAGIVGLAHATAAARAGLSVAVFERDPCARGASVRNFGMLAVFAQAQGEDLERARRNVAIWQDVASQAGIALERNGCLLLAREPQERQVLQEIAERAPASGRAAEFIERIRLRDFAPNLRTDFLIAGLWTPDAWKVDQRVASERIARWLNEEYGVAFHFSAQVRAVVPGSLTTTAGTFTAGQVIVCGGDEFATLFPDAFVRSGVVRCQLQMLRTVPQPGEWKLQPFIAGGLSLPRYHAFSSCPGMPALERMQQSRFPEHLAQGIHVIACQESDGTITIGDSHCYGNDCRRERSDRIDQLMLDELAAMIRLPDTRISHRWLGHYASQPGTDVLRLSPAKHVEIVTLTSGQGMSQAFVVAEDTIAELTR